MTQLSITAKAVLNAVITHTGSASLSCDEPVHGIFYTSNASSVAPPDVEYVASKPADGVFSQNVQTSGYMQQVTTTNMPADTQYTTTGYVWPAGSTIWIGDSPYPYTNPWDNIIGNGVYPPFPPFNPPPQTPLPYPPVYPFPTKPDLDQLEEGEHDIPGGKIIIKKIKVTDKQVEEAIEEVMGPEVSPEEKKKVLKELEDYAASEEREV
jgi:hypothetical protein